MSVLQTAPHQRGHGAAYHQALIDNILWRARGYVHRTKRITPGKAGSAKSREIQARIAANAQKRFAIAEAMKREAGVAGHDLTGELQGGIAWTDRAHILAPAGENRVQLATLAHECGHVFLHSIGTPGNHLPAHVKEMEAESYAHQAFAAHGMRMPKQITQWGRNYVGQWVAADRADGIAIDPRVEAYVWGFRSPYEPLRIVPKTWASAPAKSVRMRAPIVHGSVPTGWRWHWQALKRDAGRMTAFTLRNILYAWCAAMLLYPSLKARNWVPIELPGGQYNFTAAEHGAFLFFALCWTLVALLIWTAAHKVPGRRRPRTAERKETPERQKAAGWTAARALRQQPV